jgi:hypothetical protein
MVGLAESDVALLGGAAGPAQRGRIQGGDPGVYRAYIRFYAASPTLMVFNQFG